jgi:hypothetical protein
LERQRRRVKHAPRNARARLELGRTYIKCCLFKQASREQEIAAKDHSERQQARYEKMVAEYRMGRYDQAMRDGVTSLDLDPADDSARYWLFLSSRKAGGYNAEVPGELRMEVRAGHAPTRVDLDEVAARIGLDKTAGGLYHGDLQTTTVFRPRERPGNYLNVRLVGTTSNRDAIGARIKLVSSTATQYRQISGGSGFGCLPYEQHFGLAGDASVDSLEVRWPAGTIQRFSALPANARITITEGNDFPERR